MEISVELFDKIIEALEDAKDVYWNEFSGPWTYADLVDDLKELKAKSIPLK